MKKLYRFLEKSYLTDSYWRYNPNMFARDSNWKIKKVIPFVDVFIEKCNGKVVHVLDVGGGAGLILLKVAEYINVKHGLATEKHALDLSPKSLRIQKRMNPDLALALEGNICDTPFENKEFDLCLMIDVLEHVPDANKALLEIARISRFAIFKIPLEKNLIMRVANLLTRGKTRRDVMMKVGHVQEYDILMLFRDIRIYSGRIICFAFTNVFEYYLSPENRASISLGSRVINRLAECVFKISPMVASMLFNDFAVLLIECHE